MTTQSELQLEQTLMSQMQRLGFASVKIADDTGRIATSPRDYSGQAPSPRNDKENSLSARTITENLKIQLEKFNETTFSDDEFTRILNHIEKGDRFYKAKTLRDRFALTRDDESIFNVRFFNMDQWCKNEYQVAQQITQVGRYENRYDVTLLVNGLPLVQVELKRRGDRK